MNYRHAFHAGNFADVAKHLALLTALIHLQKKPSALAVIDTHAGRGGYDLSDDTARRTGEAEAGIGRLKTLAGKNLPGALQAYLSHALSGPLYPGSPLFAARLLRPQDRLVAIEKHPEDVVALRSILAPFLKARVEEGDGYRRLAALTPPPERRGLILIDPPFEAPDEFQSAAKAFAAAYRRFATGVYLLWFPVKSPAEADLFCGEVLASGVKKLLRLDIRLTAAPDGKLASAGLLIVNPPWQFEEDMRAALAPILPLLAAEADFIPLAAE
ncbi:23S rRNA (adenine2030-N6)-methyltransferase [Rhizomicrobium palustre]|uniref:Ribosomal RNA large subunit methyltransferase J n=1 Tax=Rhizomicrobium palustre TaxID=189966 RepID=A0A846MW83_9PROT|nr:23S rRNA (adenine(2030)-N(6))-methyltransferase RlmJ [Rhizomicrobium palustre]NIK87300.1 23S rRNA (adenine2030-N6)-methyltransferase [Rhizomicrobium palustre]